MNHTLKVLFFRGAATLLAACFLASLLSMPAQAGALDDLRASGAIGERFDGLVEARDPSASGTADTVNAKRRAVYAEKAAAQGVEPSQVGQVYAAEIFKTLPPGSWVMRQGGNWVRK